MSDLSSGRESRTFGAPPRGELLVVREEPFQEDLTPYRQWLDLVRELPRPFQRVLEVGTREVLLERIVGVDGLDLVDALTAAGRVLPLDVWLALALYWGEALLRVPSTCEGWNTPAELGHLGVDVRGALVLSFDSPNHVLGRWWRNPDTETRAGGVSRVPDSMPPESGRLVTDLTEASRVYSLAATMLALLEGRRLFDHSGSAIGVFADIAMKGVQWGRRRNPECSSELQAVLRRATSLKPSARYPTIPEFIFAVREAVQIEPASEARMLDVLLGISPQLKTCLGSVDEASLPESWKNGGVQVLQDKYLECHVPLSALPLASG